MAPWELGEYCMFRVCGVRTSGCAMTKGRRQWSPMARLTANTPITLTPFQNRICPPAASTLACRHIRAHLIGWA